MSCNVKHLAFCLAVALSVAACESASAQIVPYRARGIGAYSPITGEYGGSGRGTLLGRHTFAGNVATSPTANPFVFDWVFTAPQETVAANGDKIFFDAYGTVELIPLDATFTVFSAEWSGDFIVLGGTGRFSHAAPAGEPLKVVAVNDPFLLTDPVWTFQWTLDGRIRLRLPGGE